MVADQSVNQVRTWTPLCFCAHRYVELQNVLPLFTYPGLYTQQDVFIRQMGFDIKICAALIRNCFILFRFVMNGVYIHFLYVHMFSHKYINLWFYQIIWVPANQAFVQQCV